MKFGIIMITRDCLNTISYPSFPENRPIMIFERGSGLNVFSVNVMLKCGV